MFNIKELLGKRIAKLRKSKGLTQEQLAEKVGVQTSSISYIEVGSNYPQPNTLEKIIDVLGVNAEDVFMFNENLTEEELCKRLNQSIEFIKNDKDKLKILYDFSRNLL